MSDQVVMRFHISGRVQGVGYRAWFCEQANHLGLSGWVRNRRDGRVEALVRGPMVALEAMKREAEQGPMLARVTSVVASLDQDVPEGEGVRQAPTF